MYFQSKKPSASKVRSLVLLLPIFCILFSFSASSANSDRNIIVGTITIAGNKKTHDNIILRELLIKAGSNYSGDEFSRLVDQSRLNLLNTSLFNFVTIDTLPVPGSSGSAVNVNVIVLERWYIWPVPVLQITDRNLNSWWETRDFTRINYGLDVKWYNFTGRMDELDAIVQFGKNRQFSFAYQNPYIDRYKRFGMGFEAGYKKSREAGYLTMNDKLVFAFVPEGLSEEKYLAVNATFRNNIFITHQLIAGFNSYSFSDSLLQLNPDYSYVSENEPIFIDLYYKLKIDHRDIKYYPLKGWYFDVELSKSGLGFNFEQPVNIAWAKTTTRYFAKLAKRFYTGVSFIGKVSTSSWQPYFLIQGLGYSREYLRGYEYNVIDGKHFALLRSNVKFALLPERTRNIGFIPTPKFGLVHYAIYLSLFADAAYVWQPQWKGLYNNVLPESLLFGSGVGVDVVTYYDKVIRIEYAVNKSGKSGIFIHFIAGI